MRLDEVIARADVGIRAFMPEGSVRLLTSIDPALAYPRNLLNVLFHFRSPFSLLDDRAALTEIFLLLKKNEANALASRFVEFTPDADPYDFLCSHTFRRQRDKQVLLDFFDLIAPQPEPEVKLPGLVNVVPRFPLFPHQERALLEVQGYLETDPHRALLHMPTGSGKTRTAMHVVANFLRARTRGVVVWLAHSEELCEQAAEEFQAAWSFLGGRSVQLVRFWGSLDADATTITDGIVIAGLKKLLASLKKDGYLLRSLSAKTPFVVMDEAHQAIAPTYKMIIEQLLRPGGDARLLGLSATPGRTWNDPESDRLLSEFFACRKVTLAIAGYDNPVSYLIHKGYLAYPSFSRIKFNSSVNLTPQEKISIAESFDIPAGVLEKIGADEARNLIVVHHAEDLLRRHKRVILFATSVSQSDLIAAILTARGFCAVSVTSKSGAARSEVIADFKNDDEQSKILVNYGILTTGFDAPRTSAALIARPTLSLVLYSQMVGRAMRGYLAGGNRTCEIVTVVDTTLPGFDSVVGAFSNWEDVWGQKND